MSADQRPAKSAEGAGQLDLWRATPDPGAFPYQEVVDEFQRVGKHLVSPELLEKLNRARELMRSVPAQHGGVLLRFLDVALDKWDGRYYYPSYLALSLLPLPGTTGRDDVPVAVWTQARLITLLVTDALRFEALAAAGATSLLPRMRPDGRTVAKRFRLGLRAVEPALRQLGIAVQPSSADRIEGDEGLCVSVERDRSAQEAHILRITMLPVDVIHDEYLFIRVLQSFETTFALIVIQLRAAQALVSAADAGAATRLINSAADNLQQAAPLFSLLGTMQVEAFRTFRRYTEGASAIQSTSYKGVESTCRAPDSGRLNSPAYVSVPEVREQLRLGHASLDGAVQEACASGQLERPARRRLGMAMQRFTSTLDHWRQTHYRLAVRMLGERPGTGYTQGTPYLKEGLTLPVFSATCMEALLGEP